MLDRRLPSSRALTCLVALALLPAPGCTASDAQEAAAPRVAHDCLADDKCVVPLDCSAPWQASWEFAVSSVTGDPDSADVHLAEGVRGRMDVRCGEAEFEATVQPDTGDASAYPQTVSVVVTADALVLGDWVSVLRRQDYVGGASEVFNTITVPLDPHGSPAGTFTATGVLSQTQVDAWHHEQDIEAVGTIGPDRTAPIVRQAMPSRQGGPVDALLPWDDIDIMFSEGLDELEARASLEIVAQGAPDAGSSAVLWQKVLPQGPTPWSGATRLRTRLFDWVASSSAPQLLRWNSAVADLAGLAAVIPTPALRILPIQPGDTISFDGSNGLATWGEIVVGDEAASSSVCEGTACAIVGPISREGGGGGSLACTQPVSGFAGALHVAGDTALHVTFRSVAGTVDAPQDGPGYCDFGLDVVDESGERYSYRLAADSSAWTQLEVPIPSDQSTIGVVVWAGRYANGCPVGQAWCVLAVSEIALQ